MSRHGYDLAILGAGASGLIAADFARQLGARVVLIEKDRIGGDCTWTGCVPSKSLVKVASVAQTLRTAAQFGIDPSTPGVDMARVRAYLNQTIEQIYAPTAPDALRAKGIDVLPGAACFVSPHAVEIGGAQITARSFLINTGAAPRLPSLPGLRTVPYVTYREIFQNDRLPQTLVVVGGGPIGCEVAQCYRRLGAEVVLVAERLLPREEPEASEVLEQVFAQEGIARLRARAIDVAKDGDGIVVETQAGRAVGDLLLIATGRAPAVADLGLAAAGVNYNDAGIQTDRYLRTTARHIYAAGDVTGAPQYSHLAGWQGFHAARNALLPGRSKGWSSATPRVTFTSPEVARAGLTEATARRERRDVTVRTMPLSKVDRAVSEADRFGFVKFVAGADGRVLGGTYVGERASEAITEVVLAIQNGWKVAQLAAALHPYPTYATGIQLLATQMALDRATAGMRGKLLRLAVRLKSR